MSDGIAEMNKQYKVEITRCSDNNYWYRDMIGEEFTVTDNRHNTGCYVSAHNDKGIIEADCIRINSPLDKASAALAEAGTPLVADESFPQKSGRLLAESLQSADVRTFDTGATRDTDEGKAEHVGFNSPLADKRFGEFMHLHRTQSDGELRESSNWKKGIPKQAYIESLGRHFLELRLMYDGHDVEGTDVETTLCAIRFNTNGFLHEILKEHES